MVNINDIRKDFPILNRKIKGKDLVYFDNGATTQKPQQVIDAISTYYANENSNIHRGVHTLSQEATTKYEDARQVLQNFIGARHSHEIIFTSGTTGSINLIASSFGKKHLKKGDEIIISAMEHHSNIVPWQMICEEKGALLKVIPINQNGELILEELDQLLTPKTKLVAINHISNTLGTINPIEKIIEKVHQNGSLILIDAAQSIAHTPINVLQLDVDFLVFSGHKMFAPTGIGVLYGKEALLNDLPPYQGGGDMIKEVTFEKTTYNCLPHKLEAGTPNIVGGIGLGEAVKYIEKIGFDYIQQQETALLNYGTEQLLAIDGVRIIGTAAEKTSVISFVIDGIHPFDVGTLIDQLGVAVRTGHHCTQPLMAFFKIPGTIRASFSFYNTKEEIDIFIQALKRAIKMLI
ncbi:MAG: cysteine desulfurase [Flavobacteriales bacterium]|nr:cysteine desulfurase [Flavobacteriales bacterium]